jgi:hypothetical protein
MMGLDLSIYIEMPAILHATVTLNNLRGNLGKARKREMDEPDKKNLKEKIGM